MAYTSKTYTDILYQPISSTLTTLASITYSANIQSLLASADYSAARTNLGLVIGTNVQAYDVDLTTWAGLTPSANAQSLVTAANYAAMRGLLDLEAGTDFYSIAGADAVFQPLDSDLTAIAGLTATTDNFLVGVASAWASRTPAQVKSTLSLNNVDNTSDANKPVSTATQTALDLKAPLISPTLVTPTLGVATATSVNKITLTQPATSAVLTIADGVTLTVSANTTLSGTPLTNPMTTLGDVIYGGALGVATRLAGDTSNTRKFIRTLSVLGVATAPAWDTLQAADIPDISATYQPLDSDLTTIAGLTATTDNFIVSVASAWTSRTPTQVRTTLGLVIGTDVQAYDADLTTWGAITPGTGVATALAINVGSVGAFVTFNSALGTPSSGTLTNCTFPTLNQNSTGSASSLSISGQTGLLTVVGLTSTNRAKTVRDAADTILELGGSYTPTGTWTSLTMVTPVLGTPTSGVVTNLTGTASININGTVGATTPTTIVGTTITVNTSLLPDADDGAVLGASGTGFSDLFLASTAVINFAAGDVLITHSSNTLTFTGASSGYLYDAMNAPSTNDAAALGSGTLMWSDLFLASGGVININNGSLTLTGGTNKITLSGSGANGNQLVLAAGGTSLASLNIPAGTLTTTAVDGDIEMDANCLYACTDAGNRGVIPVEHIIRQHANRANFANNANQQAIFDSVANGTLTLETGAYLFEALIQIQGTSATSGNLKFSLVGAGGGTFTIILYTILAIDAANDALTVFSGVSEVVSTQVVTNMATATTATVTTFLVKGSFECTGAGTLIPSVAQTTSVNNSANTLAGSYFKCNRIGASTGVSTGQWS